MWLTMPMTSPFMLNMGPPELPGFTLASVWKISMSMRPCSCLGERRRALKWPTVSVCAMPRGAPMMKTWLPMRCRSESAIGATYAKSGRSPLIRMSARSVIGSEEITSALAW